MVYAFNSDKSKARLVSKNIYTMDRDVTIYAGQSASLQVYVHPNDPPILAEQIAGINEFKFGSDSYPIFVRRINPLFQTDPTTGIRTFRGFNVILFNVGNENVTIKRNQGDANITMMCWIKA